MDHENNCIHLSPSGHIDQNKFLLLLYDNTLFLDYVSFGDKTASTTHDKHFTDAIPSVLDMASMDMDPEDAD